MIHLGQTITRTTVIVQKLDPPGDLLHLVLRMGLSTRILGIEEDRNPRRAGVIDLLEPTDHEVALRGERVVGQHARDNGIDVNRAGTARLLHVEARGNRRIRVGVQRPPFRVWILQLGVRTVREPTLDEEDLRRKDGVVVRIHLWIES